MLISSAEEWFQAIGLHNHSAVRANIATYQKTVDEKGETGLMRAVRAKDIEMVHLLASFEHSMRNSSGYTALMIAASINSADICQKLAPYEMNLNTEDNRSALMLAAIEGSIDAIISLLPYQKCRADIDGRTAMMHAVLNRRFDAVKQLSLREIGYTDAMGKTAYVLALELDFQEIANFLAPLEASSLTDVRGSYGFMRRQSAAFSNLTNTTIHSSSPQAPPLRNSQANTSITYTSNTNPATTTSTRPSRTSTSCDSRSEMRSSTSQHYSSSIEPPPYISITASTKKQASGLVHVSSMPPHRAGSNINGREMEKQDKPKPSEPASITPNPNVFRSQGVAYGNPDGVATIRTSLLSKSAEPDNEHLALEDLSTRQSTSMDARSSFLQAYANTCKEMSSMRQSMSTRSSQLSRSSAQIDAQQRSQLASTVTDRMDSLELKMVALVQSNMVLAAENQALKARISRTQEGSAPESIISLAGAQSMDMESRKNSLFSKPADPSNDPSEGEVLYDPKTNLIAVKVQGVIADTKDKWRDSGKPPLPKGVTPLIEEALLLADEPGIKAKQRSMNPEEKDKELERLIKENTAYHKQILDLTKKLAAATNTPAEKLVEEYPADFCTDSTEASLSDIDIVCHDLSDNPAAGKTVAPLPHAPVAKENQEKHIQELEAQNNVLTKEVARLEHLLHQKIADPSLLSSQLGQTQKNNATEMSSPTLSEADPMELCSGTEIGSVKHMHVSADSKISEAEKEHRQVVEDHISQPKSAELSTNTNRLQDRKTGTDTDSNDVLDPLQKKVYEERIEMLEAQLKMYQDCDPGSMNLHAADLDSGKYVPIESPKEVSVHDDDTVEVLRQKIADLNSEGKRMRASSRIAERRLEKVESINDDLLDIVHAKENEILALRITLDRASMLISPKFTNSRLGLTEFSLDRKEVMSTASASHISDNSILAFGQQGAPTTQAIQSMLGIGDSKLNESHEYYNNQEVPVELMGPTGALRSGKNPFSPLTAVRANISAQYAPSKLNVLTTNKRRVQSAEINSKDHSRPLRPPTSAAGTPAALDSNTVFKTPMRSQSATIADRTGSKHQLGLDSVGKRPSSGVAAWKDDLSVKYITRDMYHSTHSISDLSVDSPEKDDGSLHMHVAIVDTIRASIDNPEERASMGSTQHEQELSNDAVKLMEKLDGYQNDILEFTEKNARLMERLDKLDTEYKELKVIHTELLNTKKAKDEVISSLEQLNQASRKSSSICASEDEVAQGAGL